MKPGKEKSVTEIEIREKLLVQYYYMLPLLAELNVKLKFLHSRKKSKNGTEEIIEVTIEEMAEAFINYQSPAIQIYTKDIRSSDDVKAMRDVQYRIYFELLFASWNSKCFLPADFKYLSKVIGKTQKTFIKEWMASVCEKFSMTPDKKFIYNDKMLGEFLKQIKNSIEASKAAKKRWNISPTGHKFIESPYFNPKTFFAELKKPEYKKWSTYDHEYYYEAVKNYSERKSVRCENWIGMVISFMQRNEAEGKPVLKGQKNKPKIIPATNGSTTDKISATEKAQAGVKKTIESLQKKVSDSSKSS